MSIENTTSPAPAATPRENVIELIFNALDAADDAGRRNAPSDFIEDATRLLEEIERRVVSYNAPFCELIFADPDSSALMDGGPF